jgi:hypothetical protein
MVYKYLLIFSVGKFKPREFFLRFIWAVFLLPREWPRAGARRITFPDLVMRILF